MTARYRKHEGVTLIEAVLVLVIASSIIVLGIRQYQSYRSDSDIRQLQYNVATLMEAMAFYYKANCYGSKQPNGAVTPGALNPVSSPLNPFVISINTLKTQGFLTASYPRSPIVDNTSPQAYVLQFNGYTQDRRVCQTGTNTAGPYDVNCTSSATIGTIFNWTAQVAVLLQDPSKAQLYLRLLAGDCLSTYQGGMVLPCEQNTPGNYVVWERQPSMVSQQLQSDLWLTNPAVEEFKQMYTTYPINYLIWSQGTVPSAEQQYFLCGS